MVVKYSKKGLLSWITTIYFILIANNSLTLIEYNDIIQERQGAFFCAKKSSYCAK